MAIKLLRTDLARDPTFQARFRREAQSAAGLNHPAIVAVYDTGEELVTESGGGIVPLPYIVMEYVEGQTLRDCSATAGRSTSTSARSRSPPACCRRSSTATSAGIVHRDIKPANVMLTPRGDVKVMDFGIARAMADSSATMTQTQAVIGTAQYLSPEQARGETVDARSDLYSAGCLLYELLTGRPPFVGDSPVAVAYQHVREKPQPPSAFNPRDPGDRRPDRPARPGQGPREPATRPPPRSRPDIDAVRAGRPIRPTPRPPGRPRWAAAATDGHTSARPPAGTRAMPPVGATTTQPGAPVPGPGGPPPGDGRRSTAAAAGPGTSCSPWPSSWYSGSSPTSSRTRSAGQRHRHHRSRCRTSSASSRPRRRTA